MLFSRIGAQAGRAIARGIGVLATIGATAPFVGWFGTIWGIMVHLPSTQQIAVAFARGRRTNYPSFVGSHPWHSRLHAKRVP